MSVEAPHRFENASPQPVDVELMLFAPGGGSWCVVSRRPRVVGAAERSGTFTGRLTLWLRVGAGDEVVIVGQVEGWRELLRQIEG